jgi:hypothetical protein
MEPEGSLPQSQELSTRLYPEPDQSMLGRPPFPIAAWRVLGLRMEGRPPTMEGSCKYNEYAAVEDR